MKLPSYHEARITFLKKEIESVNENLMKYKNEWKKTGCSIMSDGWTDGKRQSITNFLVNSPSGIVFLKSLNISDVSMDSNKLFELLDSLIEKIGEDNIVQVVTDSASAYIGAGRLLEEKRKHLFWSLCAAHCLDLILSDIGNIPVFFNILGKARQITVYIYHHTWVLSLFRNYSKNKELTRPTITRFAISYLTLKSILDRKIALRAMFASEKWTRSTYAKFETRKVQEIILSDNRFWKAIKYCLKCIFLMRVEIF